MLQPGTPSLFLELNALAGAVVAVEARLDPMMSGSDEVVLSPLDEPGGRRLLSIFGLEVTGSSPGPGGSWLSAW
jgi:hypothetical protein